MKKVYVVIFLLSLLVFAISCAENTNNTNPLITPDNNNNTDTPDTDNNTSTPDSDNSLQDKFDDIITNGIETEDENGNTPIVQAYQDSDIELIKLLLNAGANKEVLIDTKAQDDIQRQSRTILIDASARGFTEIVSIFIDAKANLEATDNYVRTALIWAAHNNYIDIVSLLIDARANINATDSYGYTALAWAEHNNLEGSYNSIIQLLKDANAK